MLDRTISKEKVRYGNALVQGNVAEMCRCAERLEHLMSARRNLEAARRNLEEILGGGR
jgi:hypothetical protein